MNTLPEKIEQAYHIYMHDPDLLPEFIEEVMALFEAEMLDIIGDGKFQLLRTNKLQYDMGWCDGRMQLRKEQLIALKEKLGREDKQPIWDALNNSDA